MKLDTVGLSGSVPNLNLPYLKHLYLGGNNLTGPIPDFDSLPNLRSLYLHKNPLNSTVPNFSNLPKLEGFAFFASGQSGRNNSRF